MSTLSGSSERWGDMRTRGAPAPGVVLGEYPERRDPPVSTLLAKTLLVQRTIWRGRRVSRYERFVAAVRRTEKSLATQTVSRRVPDLRARLAREGFLDTVLEEVFATLSLQCKRTLGAAPYDTQLMAARIMLDNHLVEMATGEGKTLAAAIAAAAAALAGVPVHVVTSNDYLATRDAAALSPLYAALGLTTGVVTQSMPAAARREAYLRDITYCTAKELGFDYLRDGLARPRGTALEQRAARLAAGAAAPEPLLRGLCMAIIDEADSILIDEARVPLVLSHAAPPRGDDAAWRRAWTLAERLAQGIDFELDHELRRARLTEPGKSRLSKWAVEDSTLWLTRRHCEDLVMTALCARHLMQRDRDYLVDGGKVLIIDEHTGRAAAGRAWSHGLHQMVEIKEACPPSTPATPVTQITYQRLFPRYLRLCGMSGTLMESRAELLGVYGLDVVPLPLRVPSRRVYLPTRVFPTRQAQWDAAAARIRQLHAQGRPVLIGTDSVRDSEELSARLSAEGLRHAVLNARQDANEARIIAAAGLRGAITVATNMAGRGTDIAVETDVRALGGLHVIACQQNAARRIDRQLIGRCARQGAPGSAETFVTLDGPLLSGRWSARLAAALSGAEMRRGKVLGLLLFRAAQRTAERRERRARQALLRMDKEISRWLAFRGREE